MSSRWIAVAVFLTASVPPLLAQTNSAPTVSVRRNNALNGPVLPADLNADGILDLVSRDSFSAGGSIIVAPGRGDGTFGAAIRSGIVGEALATADFDHDGRSDVLLAAPARLGVPPTAYVLPGRGDGTFGTARAVARASIVYFGSAADVDGDGNIDVVLGINDTIADEVLVMPGNGDLTFRTAVVLTADASPAAAAIEDVNGDRRRDLLVANHDGHSISVFLNQGAFTFAASDIPLDAQTNDVEAVDLNRDGRMDLVVAASDDGGDDLFYITGHIYVMMGNGNGTFTQPVKYDTAPGAWRVVIGDFTRDGVPDVATANRSAKQSDDFCGDLWDSVSILPGKSDATFGAASSFSLGNQSSLTSTRFRNSVQSLSAIDVNGDHHLDLVASWGAILLNQAANPNWAPRVSPSASTPDPTDHSIVLQAIATDSDHDRLTYRWTDDHGQWIEPTATPCRFVPQTLGVHRFTVTVDDGHGHTASGSVVVDFGTSTSRPPAVSVTAPAAGTILDEGKPFTIRWTATGSSALSRISVSLSTDDGGHFQPISECGSLPGSATSCTWNAAGPVTHFGRISVTATDTAGLSGSGTSGRFTIRAAPGAPLSYGWSHADVGSVAAAGSASHDGFVWNGEALTVSGSGSDIWGSADEFHYVWQTMTGDFEIETRVSSVQAVHAWTKAGLMIRARALDPASPHASIFVTPARGVVFQRRTAEGAASINTSGGPLVAPVWLRMVRQGAVLTAYYKKLLADRWKLLGQQTIAGLPSTVAVGLAVTSHADGSLATAKFQGVYLSAIPPWTTTVIGGASGSASATNGTIYTVKASGADIWGTSDSFTYVWVPISGSAQVTARVLGLQNTHAWAKAGLMVRESLEPGAKQVDAVVTPGKGLVMQIRSATDGTSATVSQKTGAAPVFIRLTTSAQAETGRIAFVQANYSFDGTLWRILGQVSVDMNRDAYVGIAVTSHDAAVQTTAMLDTVRVER
jgi:hypothetical protein